VSHAEQLCTERTEVAVDVEVGMESELCRERLEDLEAYVEERRREGQVSLVHTLEMNRGHEKEAKQKNKKMKGCDEMAERGSR
jgi:hypothetical protein